MRFSIFFLLFCLQLPAIGQLTIRRTTSDSPNVILRFQHPRSLEDGMIAGDISIENNSATWIFVEQRFDMPGTPVQLTAGVWVLGPWHRVQFNEVRVKEGDYLAVRTASPLAIGDANAPGRAAAFSAFTIDLITRGLFTHELPSDFFQGEAWEGRIDTAVAYLNKLTLAVITRIGGEEAGTLFSGNPFDILLTLNELMRDEAFGRKIKELYSSYLESLVVDSALRAGAFLWDAINLYEKLELVGELGFSTRYTAPVSSAEIRWINNAPASAPPPPTQLVAVTVSSSQIHLSWAQEGTTHREFRLEKRQIGEPWAPLRLLTAGARTYSDTSLNSGTRYEYRVFAINDSGVSGPSNTATATTSLPPEANPTLTVDADSAGGPIALSIYSGNGILAATTTHTQIYPRNARVTVACPPRIASGHVFSAWLLDGRVHSASQAVKIVMDRSHALTAVYRTEPPPNRVVRSVTIEGPTYLQERSSAEYSARIAYTDGTAERTTTSVSWSVDSPLARVSARGLLDCDSVESEARITLSCAYSYGGSTIVGSKIISIRNGDVRPTYSLTRLITGDGEIGFSPQATRYSAGTTVSLHANRNSGSVFSHWSGDASGTDDDITIVMDGNKSVMAHFVSDPRVGSLNLTLLPPEAAEAGARWRYRNYTEWRASGDGLTSVPPGEGTVTFTDIAGWRTPAQMRATVVGGQSLALNATYLPVPGTLQVTIEPSAAIAGGARWRLSGSSQWRNSGEAVYDIAPGVYGIEFSEATEWVAPTTMVVEVPRGGSAVRVGAYGPPNGTPIISGVSPRNSGIEGGGNIMIEGANLGDATEVRIGGRGALDLRREGSTRLTATIPPSDRFGSAEIFVRTPSGVAVNSLLFSYVNPRGTNLTLLGSTGGTFQAAAVDTQTQTLLLSQGSALSFFDISTPTSPRLRARLSVPGMIREIAISGTLAAVAAGDAGVHLVNITNPDAPSLRGFFQTGGDMYSVVMLGGRAYAIDRTTGLWILDVATGETPTLVAKLNLEPQASHLQIKATAAGLFAFVAAENKMITVDVSDPSRPSKAGEVEVPYDNRSIALAGNLAFLGRLANGIDVVDISNPRAPQRLPTAFDKNGAFYSCVSSGNRVVLAGNASDAVRFVEVSGTTITERGRLHNSIASIGNALYRPAFRNNLLWLPAGTVMFGINAADPNEPVKTLTHRDESGNFRRIAVRGDVAGVGTQNSDGSGGALFAYNHAEARPRLINGQDRDRGSTALTVLGDVIVDYRATFAHRSRLGANGLEALTSLAIPVRSVEDADATGGRSIMAGIGTGDRIVLVEGDPAQNGPDWVLRRVELTSRSAGGGGVQIAAHGEILALGYFDIDESRPKLELRRLDQSDPIWSLPGGETISSLRISHAGRFLHVGRPRAYQIYDLQSAPPTLAATVTLANNVNEIIVDSDHAYLAAGGTGVVVYDIADPTQPRQIRSYNTPGSALSVAKSGERLLVADSTGGLQILGITDIEAPKVFITAPVFDTAFITTSARVAVGGSATDDSGSLRSISWSNSRGGGESVSGREDWLFDIPLHPGANTISIRAMDAAGNIGEDTITISAVQPDATAPIVRVLEPTADLEFVTGTERIALRGTAVDNAGVREVRIVSALGDATPATLELPDGWAGEVSLQPGPNVIRIIAVDAADNEATAELVVFRSEPDNTPPAVSVLFPTIYAEWETSEATVSLSGDAMDNSGLGSVRWSNNRGGGGEATGWRPWYANDIPLHPGLNVISIVAEDGFLNRSTDTLAVTYIEPAPRFAAVQSNAAEVLLSIESTPNSQLVIEISTDLAGWIATSENYTAGADGRVLVRVPAPGPHQAFFRIKR